MTQKEKVLRHLRDYGSLTQLEALAEYGIMRLGARVWDLRKMGYDITSEIIEGRNRYGETVHYARYSMAAAEGAA